MHTVMGKALTHQDELLGFAIWTEVGYQDNWVDDIKVIAQQIGGHTALAN